MAKTTLNTVHEAPELKNKKDQENLFKDASVDALREVAQYMGIRDSQIPEDATKEDLIALLDAAKRHDISVAKAIKIDGKDYDCPPGYMVIKVTPKAGGMGSEWGPKSKEMFFFAMQGDAVVGRRGVTVVIPDKYRSCWRDAIKFEYEMDPTPRSDGSAPGPKRTEVMTEDVAELLHNPDVEAEKEAERLLVENSKKNMEEKRAAKALGLADLIKQARNG